MKKYSLILIVVFLLSVGSTFGQEAPQEKTKSEIEKELAIQKAIDEQKKVMSDQKKKNAEAEAALESSKANLEDQARQLEPRVESRGRSGDVVRVYTPRDNRTFSTGDGFSFSSQGGMTIFDHFGGNDTERTTWDFSKSIKENTFSKEYTFDVEKAAGLVVISVNGDCKAGEIRIKIIMPNGKVYSDTVIDEFGNLNLRKSFSITETENQDKTGSWKFQITSTKATGFFKISFQTS